MDSKALNLIKKLKALSERGVGGEKFNAKAQLDKFLKKYGITLADLESEDIKEMKFKVPKAHNLLFIHVAYSVMLANFTYATVGTSTLYFKCNEAQATEIRMKFEFFKRAYLKQQKIFFRAFLQRNMLVRIPDDDEPEKELTDKEREEIKEIVHMASSMKSSEFLKSLPRAVGH